MSRIKLGESELGKKYHFRFVQTSKFLFLKNRLILLRLTNERLLLMNGPSALMTKKVQVSSIMKQSMIWLLTKWHLQSIVWIVFIHRCLLYARLSKPNVNKNDTMNVNRNGQHSAGHRLYLAGLPRC